MLEAHLERTAGPVLAAVTLVSATDLSLRDLAAAGIVGGELHVAAEPTFALWNPDGGEYRTRAAPIAPTRRRSDTAVSRRARHTHTTPDGRRGARNRGS